MDGISVSQLLVIIAIAVPIFWIYTLVDLLKSKRKDKFVWILVLIFLNVIGIILYWSMKPKDSPPSSP